MEPTELESGSYLSVVSLFDFIMEAENNSLKVAQRSFKRKNTPAPEGPELLSPGKFSQPNSMDEGIHANYLGMLPFYTT